MSLYTGLADWHTDLGGGDYLTTAPVVWALGRVGGPVVTVPPGFGFDVSVPRALRWLADPARVEYRKAACLHDWLLLDGWDRWTAAAVFYNALRADNIWRGRATAMTLATIWRRWWLT